MGQETIGAGAAELKGGDLTKAAWEVSDKSEDFVTFKRRLPQRGLVGDQALSAC